MKNLYDLTDKKTLSNTIEILTANPVFAVGMELINKLFSTDTIKAQQATAEKLIEQGKDSGVDEMEIVVDNTRGFKLNLPIDKDIKIDTIIGADEKMHIKVKYMQENNEGEIPVAQAIVTQSVQNDTNKSKTRLIWVMGGIIVALVVALVIVLL